MRKPRYNPGVDDDPIGGIWYYVYLKPKWELVILHGEERLHLDMWEKHVIPMLKKKYKLSAKRAVRLMDVSYAMPRGRVTEFVERGTSTFIIRHGDDFPQGTSKNSELKKIVAYFGLTNRIVLKQVEFEVDPHEQMDPEEQDVLEEIIGPVPY